MIRRTKAQIATFTIWASRYCWIVEGEGQALMTTQWADRQM